jgi:hypothetical protein
MPSFIKNLTVDCQDALRVARFWAAALVSDVDEESTAERAYVQAPGWVARTSGFEVIAGQRRHPTECTLTSARSPAWARKSTAWSPWAPRSCSGTTTSPSCRIRKATSSASSQDQTIPTRPQVVNELQDPTPPSAPTPLAQALSH